MGRRYDHAGTGHSLRATEDEDVKGQVTVLEKAFRNPLTKALQRELNLLRHRGYRRGGPFKELVKFAQPRNLREWLDRTASKPEDDDYPRIVCSEALL